jgi:salicylate hydroxylase/6-hydroxynicotinate 3-monooxygenase
MCRASLAGLPTALRSRTLLHNVDIGTSRTKWWGRDRHIVIYNVTAARDEVYFTTSQPEKADWMTRESWSAKGDLADMRAAFVSFHSDVQAVLAAAPEVHKWGIYEREPLSAWRKGRVVLLGDACHPMTPYMASGAAMALEDAVVLARCLDDARGDVDTAFQTYERHPQAPRQRGAGRLQREQLDAPGDQSGLALRLRRLARAAALRGGLAIGIDHLGSLKFWEA